MSPRSEAELRLRYHRATVLSGNDPFAPDSDTVEAALEHVGFMPGMSLLIVGPSFTSSVPLPGQGGQVLVGRGEESDLQIPDASVSRRHALLRVEDARVTIEDLGSVNGTRVGGHSLGQGESTALAPGLPAELGSVVLIVRMSDCSSPDARPPDALVVQAEPHHEVGSADGIVIIDARMREIHRVLEKAAASSMPVLLLGETGTGKEILAERLHRLSARANRPLLRLNCAAFSESLLEAELFGYERGAFTGATAAKPGLLEVADGGTVFLDEVGELPALLQAKLLRVLEDSQVRRVGALKNRTVDVRVVSATNRDLERECDEGRFRRDLFFRINGVAIEVPPLRERRTELLALSRRFLDEAARRAGRSTMRLGAAVESLLLQYAWPGNVRELRHAMEHAVMMASEAEVSLADLPDRLRGDGAVSVSIASARLKDRQQANEREVILEALREANGNQTRAAKILGIARSTLVKRLERHSLPRPRKDS